MGPPSLWSVDVIDVEKQPLLPSPPCRRFRRCHVHNRGALNPACHFNFRKSGASSKPIELTEFNNHAKPSKAGPSGKPVKATKPGKPVKPLQRPRRNFRGVTRRAFKDTSTRLRKLTLTVRKAFVPISGVRSRAIGLSIAIAGFGMAT